MKYDFKDEYFDENECKQAVEEYNKNKSPEDEELRYCSYVNSLTGKRMYVPCAKEYFYLWRNELAEEHRKRDLETRCLVPSERYNQMKKCMEDCKCCPYGKNHRDGAPISLDSFTETYGDIIKDDSPSIEDRILEEELKDALDAEIAKLDKTSQRILRMFFEGHTDEEIGFVLDMRRSTVQYQKTRLFKLLREKLKDFKV